VVSVAEAEFLAPPLRLVTDKDRRRHRHQQRRLLIAERDEHLMQQWYESFPGDVRDKEEFYAIKREERRADRRCHREFASKSSRTQTQRSDFDSDGPMWDYLCTETTSDDNE
jgi:hypothetical protein